MATLGRTLDASIPSHVDDDCGSAEHLGLVLVHGIGSQAPGETLLAWSARLIRMLASLSGSDEVTPADLVFRSAIDLQGKQLSTIELRIPLGDGRPREQHWLLTEAYWAASIEPPSAQTMLAWLGARGAAALLAPGLEVTKRLRNTVYLSGIVIGVLVLYAAIRVVTSIIPLAAVRNAFVAPLDRLLTGWLGDMEVLLSEPAQSSNVRTRVREAMQAVAAAHFPRMVVVAHSGGAVASYMTLTDSVPWDKTAPSVRSYITLGQGLNAGWRLAGVGDGASCSLATGIGRRLTANVYTNNKELRWYDYHSEGDMVSGNGLSPPDCLVDAVPKAPDEQSVENKPSNPHGTYWDNDEEFLLPVVQRLLAAGRSDVPAEEPEPDFPALDPTWHARRLLRIGMFSLTSRLLFSAMMTAVVGSALLGGARMGDLGSAVMTTAAAIPGAEIVTHGLSALQGATSVGGLLWARTSGTVVVTLLLLLAASYPILTLLTTKRAWEAAQGRWFNALVWAVDVSAAVLPLVPLAMWVGLVAGHPKDPRYAPYVTVLFGLVLGAIFVFGVERWLRRRLTWTLPGGTSGALAAATLAVAGIAAFSAVVAVVSDTQYGGTSLFVAGVGSIAVWLLFKLLSRVANWRWDAWDEQEREQFRQSQRKVPSVKARRLGGRRIDILVVSLVGAAGLALAVAIGAPFVPDDVVPKAFGLALSIVLVIGLIGTGQDAANSYAGVKPQKVSPLPRISG